ncbi:hypothetical protein JK359_07215 [Streptomyces actinomycinicus]|uniref:Uncharacterized protein n=1 Tax=Streptomyces actinomycinicus TaxID=1695166 RepID=A0A937EF03_9ACTN|nr:hypothetical protein [Streptomyces actinomycinicus]MBL1081772.1 hypothetical protein [Streptomyces actinomycinicus]
MTEQTQAERPVPEPAAPALPPRPAGPPPAPDAATTAVPAPAVAAAAVPVPDTVAAAVPAADTVAAAVPVTEKDRRALRTVLRWTAAVAVFAVVGAGTAYGITEMDRTDLPGLATASDGRWDYPELVRPPVPAGSPGPLAAGNGAGAHYADLRALLLPAPEGATADPAMRGTDGWLATKDFLAQYTDADDRRELGQKLTDYGLRHIAARGWTTADGTRTRIQLLQFGTAAVADEVLDNNLINASAPRYPVRGADYYELDETFPVKARAEDVTLVPYAETKPYGAGQIRQAYFAAGDTVAVITLSRKGGVNAVPFRQTVTLQTELLS